MENRDDKQLNRHLGKPLSLQFPRVHCSTTHLPTHKPASLPFPYPWAHITLTHSKPLGWGDRQLRRQGWWMMLSCCSLFLTVFFLPSFLLVCSSPAQVLHRLQSLLGIPAPVWVTHGMQHLPHQNIFSPSLTMFSSKCLLLLYLLMYPFLTHPHISSCSSLFSPLISPHDPWRSWDSSDWPLPNRGKASIKDYAGAGRRFALQLPKQLLSICTELSTFMVVTPGPCITTKCRVRKTGTKEARASLGVTIRPSQPDPCHTTFQPRFCSHWSYFMLRQWKRYFNRLGDTQSFFLVYLPPLHSLQKFRLQLK